MFVLKSKYLKMEQTLKAELDYYHRFNFSLTVKIQAMKKEKRVSASAVPSPQLTREDVTRLLNLCHPDKHGGKQMANDMTAKLLKLRDSC